MVLGDNGLSSHVAAGRRAGSVHGASYATSTQKRFIDGFAAAFTGRSPTCPGAVPTGGIPLPGRDDISMRKRCIFRRGMGIDAVRNSVVFELGAECTQHVGRGIG